MILVVGSTGFLGMEICRRLREGGDAVRALVRTTSDPAAVDGLRAMGATIVHGDLRERASLDAACRGVRTVISTATTTRSRQPGDSIERTDEEGQLALVDAARGAGVKRVVYVSYSSTLDDDGPLTHAKRAVEQRIMDSGMTYAILRPTFFMEVWLSPALGFDFPNRKATVYGEGRNPISYISLGDVAEFAVRAARDEAVPPVLDLGGPEPVAPLDVVRTFEEIGGGKFEVQRVPEDALIAQEKSATDSLEKAFASLMLQCARGDAIPMKETMKRVPVTLTSVRDYARRVLRA